MIDGLKPYPKMKDSGIPWLGAVPEHWEVSRLKRVCRLAYGDALASEARRDGDVPVYGSNGKVGSHSVANTQQPCLVIGRKGSFGKVNFSSEPVFAIDTTFYVDSRTSLADIRWLYYLLGWLRLDEVSRDSAIPGLNREDAYQKSVPTPPRPEQTAIVRFLDYADRRIRRYIRAKQKLIKLLEEQKQAIIHRAVTRGLDPNVRLKPSGVEWLGDVPEHWEIKKLRFLFRYAKGKRAAELTNEFIGNHPGEFPVFSGQTGHDGLLGQIDFYEFSFSSPVILVSTVGARAMTTRILSGKFSLSQNCALIIPRSDEINTTYFEGVLQHLFAFERHSISQVMQPSLRFLDLNRFYVPNPPVNEQKTIASVIERDCSKISSSMSRVAQEITLLREYRTRLIADVITGKLDVREAAARLPVESDDSEPTDEAEALADGEAEADGLDPELEEAEA